MAGSAVTVVVCDFAAISSVLISWIALTKALTNTGLSLPPNPSPKLAINFDGPMVDKYSRTDTCTDSIDSNYAYAYCLVQNNVEIEVVGPDLTDLTKLGIILGTVLGFLTLLFLLFFTVKTQCCTEFDFFSKKKKYIPTREELYLDNYVTTKRQQKRKISKSSIVDNSSEKSNNLKKSNNFINEWHDKEQYKDDTSNMQMNKLRSSAQS